MSTKAAAKSRPAKTRTAASRKAKPAASRRPSKGATKAGKTAAKPRLIKRAAPARVPVKPKAAPAKPAPKAAGTAGGKREGLNGPDPALMKAQSGVWNLLMNYYFRLEIDGWDKLPNRPVLLIGVHSGGPLTMDAWTVALAWWRHFQGKRVLHGTAHDVLMKSPGLGTYFRRMGTISPSSENIQAAFEKGDDVILWPGGEVDAYRKWTHRDKAVLGDRRGFVRLAIRSGVPIVPIATIGGHDTLFVLSEGRGLAKFLKLKERMRSDVAPITLSLPFGVALHLTPFQHIPLPSKIRTEILEPVFLDADPARADDEDYVNAMFAKIEGRIQAGMDKLAKKRKFPIFG
jgi:1-acyl-sn-glycerol-3-phosphate acyltransferase